MTEAVIKASYHTYSRVLGRKMLQMVFEVPIEQAPMVHQIMGEPQPDGSTLVAIARLQEPSAKAEKPKRNWNELSRAEQAGIACNDPGFQEFLRREGYAVNNAESASVAVRQWCLVKSRAELDGNPIKAATWDKLYSEYQRWQRGAAA